MNLPLKELVEVANFWVSHLENKTILQKEWNVKVTNKDNKITYESNKLVSNNVVEALMEQYMLTYIHSLYLKNKT